MNYLLIRYTLFAFLFFLFSCSLDKSKNEQAFEKLNVAVVNYPLYYFAKTIGGDHVKVYLPSISGDPAYWKPELKQVIKFQNADLILINGAGYANWIEKVSLPSSKICNTSLSFKGQWIESSELVVHSHGADGEHSHKGTAFTTWMNFNFAAVQAEVVYTELVAKMPEHAEELTSNFEKLKNDLIALDRKANQIGKKLEGNTVLGSHPVYQYFIAAYGIKMITLHWEPDEMPSAEMWDELKKASKIHGISIMVWEDEPLMEIVEMLSEMEIRVSVINPQANRPKKGNFIEALNKSLDSLDQNLSSEAK